MRLPRPAHFGVSLALIISVLQVPAAVGEARTSAAAASPEMAALEQAKETGESVEVASQTTETSRFSATPDGTFQMETSPVPVRVQRDGRWHDVDLTLERRSDGSVAPRLSAVDVSFGGGGSNTLVTMAKGGRSLTLTWPDGQLPQPVLDGDSATYADAGGAGIDLVVRATPRGLGTFVVVKTPEAAQSGRLDQIDFGLRTSGVQLKEQPDEALVAVGSDGDEVFSAPTPTMWEGTRSAEEASPQSPDPAEVVAGPASGSEEKPMDVELSAGQLSVVPDAELLRAPDTKFPIVVDPAWQVWNGDRESGDGAGWAYVDRSFADEAYWQPTYLKMGKETEDGTYKQSYIRLDTSALWEWSGTHAVQVHNVRLTFDSNHKWSCSVHRNVNLHLSKGLTSTTTWNSRPDDFQPPDLPADLALPADGWLARSPVDVAYTCGDLDGANDVAFTGPNLTKMIQIATNRNWDSALIGVMPQARYPNSGWDDTFNWVRFGTEPRMVVEFSRYPNAPENLRLHNGGTDERACTPGSARQWVGASPEGRQLRADLSDIDGDGSGGYTGQKLRGRFELEQIVEEAGGTSIDTWQVFSPSDGTWAVANSSGVYPAAMTHMRQDPSVTADGGTLYRWRVQAEDETGLDGPWSHLCEFMVDGKRPNRPKLASVQYPERRWSGWDSAARKYQAGTFTFSPNGSGDVKQFKYRLKGSGEPQTLNVALGASAQMSWTPDSFGPTWIEGWSVDRAGNESEVTRYEFGVEQPPRDAAWSMDDPDGDRVQAVAGTGVFRPAVDLVFTGASLNQPGNISQVAADRSVKLAGTGFGKAQAGVDTSRRFMFSTWVKLASTTGDQVVMSQQASDGGVFELGWLGGRWTFRHRKGTTTVSAVRDLPSPETAGIAWPNAWVSLMGGYDPEKKQLWLRSQAPQRCVSESSGCLPSPVMEPATVVASDTTVPAVGDGPLNFGQSPNASNRLNGWIDDSQLWPLAHPDETSLRAIYGETVQDQQFTGKTLRIVSAGSGMCLDVAGGSHDSRANVLQWTCNAGSPQDWRFEDVGGGYYRIINPTSTKCLDVDSTDGSGTADGRNVWQYDCNGGDSQKWKPNLVPGGYELRAKISNKCMDVAGAALTAGAEVRQWTCFGGTGQVWKLSKQRLHEFAGITYRLKNANSSKCLETGGGLTTAGAEVWQWDCNGGAWQDWKFVDSGDGIHYFLQSAHTANSSTPQCLEVAGGAGAVQVGANVKQWDCNGGDWQKWLLLPHGDDGAAGYRLIAKHSGMSLDVLNGSTANGDPGNAVQYPLNEQATHQIWKLGCVPGQEWRCPAA